MKLKNVKPLEYNRFEIGGQIGLFESESLFSIGDLVLVVEIEEGNSLLVDLD